MIGATFAADELDYALHAWSKIVGGVTFEWAHAPYGSLTAGLGRGESPLTAEGAACNLVLLRFHDLMEGVRHPEQRHKVLTKQVTTRPERPAVLYLSAV